MVKWLLTFSFMFSSFAGAQDCTSDEFVFDYYGKYQCKLGGTPKACEVIPKGTLAALAGGFGYVVGKKIGTAVGKRFGDSEVLNQAGDAYEVKVKAHEKMNAVAKQWSEVRRQLLGQNGPKKVSDVDLRKMKNEIRWAFFDGPSADSSQKGMEREFLEELTKVEKYTQGNPPVKPEEMVSAVKSVDSILTKARSYRLERFSYQLSVSPYRGEECNIRTHYRGV